MRRNTPRRVCRDNLDARAIQQQVELSEQAAPPAQVRKRRKPVVVDENRDRVLSGGQDQVSDLIRVVHLGGRPRADRTASDKSSVDPELITRVGGDSEPRPVPILCIEGECAPEAAPGVARTRLAPTPDPLRLPIHGYGTLPLRTTQPLSPLAKPLMIERCSKK